MLIGNISCLATCNAVRFLDANFPAIFFFYFFNRDADDAASFFFGLLSFVSPSHCLSSPVPSPTPIAIPYVFYCAENGLFSGSLSLSLSPPRFSLSPCVSIFLLLNFNSFPFVFRRRNCRDEVVGATEGRGKKIKPTLHHRRCHKPYINVTKRFPSLYFDKKII